jgi:hypothetical protein
LSQKSESTLLVEGSIPSGLVSQTQGGHDEYQIDAPKPPNNAVSNGASSPAALVTTGDYEVLGLQVTVATVFGNCFGAYIFSLVVF